jgi:hypothetical protein
VDTEESVAEKIETRRVAKPKGVRLWLSIVIVLFGIALVGVGAAGAISERGLVMPAGFVLVFGFGYVAVGGSRVKVKSPGAGLEAEMDLPQDTTVHTTFVTKGFPRQGAMPPKHGVMPPKEGSSPLQEPTDADSGRGR